MRPENHIIFVRLYFIAISIISIVGMFKSLIGSGFKNGIELTWVFFILLASMVRYTPRVVKFFSYALAASAFISFTVIIFGIFVLDKIDWIHKEIYVLGFVLDVSSPNRFIYGLSFLMILCVVPALIFLLSKRKGVSP